MTRGLQKVQAQQKAKEREAAKAGGKSLIGKDRGLKFKCPKCMLDVDSAANLKIHWTAKHPKDPEPDYEKCKREEPKK